MRVTLALRTLSGKLFHEDGTATANARFARREACLCVLGIM